MISFNNKNNQIFLTSYNNSNSIIGSYTNFDNRFNALKNMQNPFEFEISDNIFDDEYELNKFYKNFLYK